MAPEGTVPTAARTLPELVAWCAEQHADREAIADGPVRLDFARLASEVERVARALLARGVAPGDRVAIWAPNGWRWVVAALGVVSVGAVLVPVNTRFKGAEAGHLLSRTRARLLLTDDGFLGNPYLAMLDGQDLPSLTTAVVLGARPARPDGGPTVVTWDDFLAGGDAVLVAEARRRAAAVRPDDVADLFFTSGTTGRPRGVIGTHAQAIALYVAWSERATLRPGDRCLLVNPFFHTFGYKAGVIACLLRGATIVPQPVFDVAATLDLVERERITVLPGPPTLYTSLLAHPDRVDRDLSSLRVAVTGATTVPVVLIERLRGELGMRTVLTAYGLTECGGTATMCHPEDDPVTVATTCGVPVDGVEVRVVGGAGASLPPGEPGEVLVRGYNVTRGYFEESEATREAIDPDGWLHTGDVGVLDERGYLRITDRLKDMFIVGGFNAYPAEIEQALVRYPGIVDAAVVGMPDARLGEVARAYVVPARDAVVDPAEVVAYCRANLANYKVPRSVVVVPELPRNASGKVVKAELRRVP
ncbi:FadD3 family acyl-CoA ligase [Micromonospora sp. NBRC 101691]|uniref:FadD3 family acyl-CoA ligase n=1 Tax=Micromonospora sp. NBRC 101691 TaxID=3032198 RepID=UPI0024A5EB69|nr:FadD3 family acyl-CoA ligase [Micromonospora sp. NBRC 101691]GLY24618.1 3-[(3aS,4S,7aS)-7a-methyl-1,5-dioxo-octahydro-1H-inden-4-yl]propanoyl:CoA ligase [Micromonospora sp. NBRC 101691]